MSYTLGIDGGATATKWALRKADGTFIEGNSGPIDGHIYRSESKERLEKVLKEIKITSGSEIVTSIYAGLTGLGKEGEAEVMQLIKKEFPQARVELALDIVLGYRANFDLGAGIFLYAGTGSIAIHISKSGEIIRSGGWGYLLGDEGAGYWIGREAIRESVKSLDMKVQLEALDREILKSIGANNWDEVKAFVYSNDRSAIAALSSTVVSLAKTGDTKSIKILQTAGIHLSELVERIELVIGNTGLPVVIGGGIAGASPLLVETIGAKLNRSVVVSNVRIANRAAELAAIS